VNTNSPAIKVAIIDPVGIKAGMDHYDLLLLEGLQKAGAEVRLYSNIRAEQKIKTHLFFNNTGVSKVRAILSNFTGFYKSLRNAKKQGVKWLLLHVFRAGMFDLFTFTLARIMGFRICAIVHDIESLDTYTLPIVRRTVIQRLPHLRTVHNEFSKKELLKSLGKPELKTYVIPHLNFVDLFSDQRNLTFSSATELHPQLATVIAQKIPVFVFFGQIKNAKGIDLLLEAVCQVKGDFRLVIAGKMREGRWSHYEQMIRALNINEKVLPVIRHITDEERNLLFREAKAVVLPYHKIYQSGVLLMAMSFPALVIASALPPNREIVADGVNGLLFNAGSSPDLARRIQEVLDDKIEENSLKNAALERMKSGFSPEKIGSDYYRLLTVYQG
jgi:glycosyltransferase involved in cell wall biosynthesis